MKKNKLLLVCSLVLGVPSVVMGLGQTMNPTTVDATPLNAPITFSEKGYSNAADVTEVAVDSNVKLIFEKGDGSNPPKYYTTGKAVRMYAKNTLAISVSSNYYISTIDMNFVNGYVPTEANMTLSGGTLKVNGTSATITADSSISEVSFINSSSAQYRITSLTVNYELANSDVTLYDVTFNANGGLIGGQEGVTEKVLSVEEGKSIGEALPTATRDRYTFLGWYDSSD